MPSALIVGGTGFVGQYLVRQLEGRYTLRTTGRAHDIRDKVRLCDLVTEYSPQVVINLAGITTVAEAVEKPRETYETSFVGLLNLLEALTETGFEGRFLQVGSSEVYGFPSTQELPLTEDSPLRPMSPYAVAKAACDMLCHQWARLEKFPVMVARPFTHVGPRQSDRFAVARFAKLIRGIMRGRSEPRIEIGNLDATRDLTDVRDVARAYDMIIHAGHNGGVYNVCSGVEVRMRDVLDELIKLSGRAIEKVEQPSLVRSAEQQRLRGSFAALEAVTGWAPEIPLTRTLSDMLSAIE